LIESIQDTAGILIANLDLSSYLPNKVGLELMISFVGVCRDAIQ